MVAGRLQEKNGFYYIVLSYTDSAGKRRQPWIGTGLPVKGNKKRAEKMLAEIQQETLDFFEDESEEMNDFEESEEKEKHQAE